MISKYLVIPMIISIFGLLVSCNINSESDDDECLCNPGGGKGVNGNAPCFDECISYQTEYVDSVNSPTEGMVKDTVNIEVNFSFINGCGRFGEFIGTENGNSRTIEVEAKYEGCVCAAVVSTQKVNYEFVATRAGNYELNFISSPAEFITVDLDIK